MTKKDPETVFYHIKGKQNVRVSQVMASITSFLICKEEGMEERHFN